MSGRMPGLRAYILISDLFTLPVSILMLVMFPFPPDITFQPLPAIAISTLAKSLAVVLILQSLKTEDISRVIPLSSISPIFVALLAGVFLSEGLSGIQWLSIAAIATGAG